MAEERQADIIGLDRVRDAHVIRYLDDAIGELEEMAEGLRLRREWYHRRLAGQLELPLYVCVLTRPTRPPLGDPL